MFPSNQNNNNDDQYMDFDDLFPKHDDHQLPFVHHQEYSNMNYDHDHMVANYSSFADHDQTNTNTNTNTNNSIVVLDFKNPTGAGSSSWPNQPELDLPAAAVEINKVDIGDQQINYKKVSHKETERQRRQEMTKLHSSLRDLLPLQYIKGKRSVAEHMSEAVNYISHLQNRIKELENKKEKMIKKGSDSSSTSRGIRSSSSSNVVISVNPCYSGVEVLISCDHDEVLLSKVMEALVEEGHDIISCVSNLVNHKLLHNIKSQVNDPSEIDLFMLQQKLSYICD